MRMDFQKGRYVAQLAANAQDVLACQTLRHRCFHGGDGIDVDDYDSAFAHLMITDTACGRLVGTMRHRVSTGRDAATGYAATFYDTSKFGALVKTTLEIGRFCTDPTQHDPHIVRVAWGAITQIVDQQGVQLIFGCTSFSGTDPSPYARVFQRLGQTHVAPIRFGTLRKSDHILALRGVAAAGARQSPMPPLLRTYLAMGGWVSDHAVIDPVMQTLHVLTGLEISQVPPARAKALRALV